MSILPASGLGDESTGFYSFEIDQSLRWNRGDNGRLEMTPQSSNRQTYTLSVWVKRANIDISQHLFGGETNNGLGNQFTSFNLDSSGRFRFDRLQDGTNNTVAATKLLRDTTNWYHLVGIADTTQSTETERIRLYINGLLQLNLTEINSGYPAQNLNTIINIPNQNTRHIIGSAGYNNNSNFDGCMAEMNFVDGTAIGHTSRTNTSTGETEYVIDEFGEFNNGLWVPKAYTGSYGTNGFRLTFASGDLNTSGSAISDPHGSSTDVPDDSFADASGSGNHYAVTALLSSDIMLDSPTNNFCTLNDLSGTTHTATLTEGALKAEGSDQAAIGTFGMTSGKWFWEGRCGTIGGSGSNFIGVVQMDYKLKDQGSSHTNGRTYANNGYIYVKDASSTITNTSTTYTTGDIIGVAVDLDNGTIKWYKNGTEVSNSTVSDLNSHVDGNQGWLPWTNFGNATGNFILNFGQDGTFAGNLTGGNVGTETDGNGKGQFKYSVPSGYLALCAFNLPHPAISAAKSTQSTDHFDTIIYSGSSSNQTKTLSFQADWLWFKERTTAGIQHQFFDSSRLHSTTNAKLQSRLESPNNVSETDSVAIQSQSGNDVTLLGGVSTVNDQYSRTYTMWHWKANGGTTGTNTDGDITSTVQANQTAGFSIVTYTGTGTEAHTVGHGLGKKPAWVLVKSRSEAQNWHIYHHNLDETAPHNYTIFLNADNARASSSSTYWGGSAPTTTVMGVGSDNSSNKNGTTYVMYCFAEIDGYSRFGTYSGNSNADGTYVFTGFRPAMVIFKATHSDDWVIADNKRDKDNVVVGQLFPSSNAAESRSNNICDFLSNGFKLRRNAGSLNQNTYIYMAFAEQPFKFSNAR